MKKCFVLLISLVLIGLLQGATIIVDIEGNGDYTSIQEGVDASADGDTVLVYPGRYYENVDYNNHTITLGSLNLTTGERHYIRETIIDGNQEDCCIIVKRAESEGTLLCGFTITNGTGQSMSYGDGGGIYVCGGYGAQIEVRNCIIENNLAIREGGGIYVTFGSYIYLSGTTIRFNYAPFSSGGIMKGDSSILEFDQENLCSIYGNYSSIGCMMGRGIDPDDPDTLYIYADTLSFEVPDRYFISQIAGNIYFEPDEYLLIESQHCYYDFIDADLYVSSDGDDANSGLTPDEPKKTISGAITLSVSNPDNPNTVHLLPGYYSTSSNDQYFPLNMKEFVSLEGSSREEVFLDREDSSGYVNDWLSGYNYSISNMTFTGGEDIGGLTPNDLHLFGFNFEPTGDLILDSLRFNSSIGALSIMVGSIDMEVSNIIIEDSNSAFLDYDPIPGNRSNIKNVICKTSRATSISNDNYTETDDLPVLNVINYLQVDNSVEALTRMWSYGPVATGYAVTNFINCTLMNNSIVPSNNEAFAQAYRGGEMNFYNSIVYGNVGTQLNLDTNGEDRPSTATISHSLLQEGEAGIVHEGETVLNWLDGNLDYDPMLDDDYKPLDDSPVIDAGTLDLPDGIELPETDVYGNQRIYGNGIDMGAVEWQGTGVSQEEIVQSPDAILVYPNPMHINQGRGSVFIYYPASSDEAVYELSIYNIKGQKLRKLKIEDGKQETGDGRGSVIWDGKDDRGNFVSSGVYFVRVKVGDEYIAQKKVTVVN